MGILTDSMFSALMSWVRALVSAIWALFSSERMTALEFLAKNWIGVAVVIILAGLVIDWLVWLIRWQPYHIWAQRVRRLLRIAAPEADEEAYAAQQDEEDVARAAYEAFEEPYMPPQETGDTEEDYGQWMPLASPVMDEADAQQAMDAAEKVPDEALGRYPGMRYDSQAAQREALSDTRPFAAIHQEGPGAAEVSRRRAEIDAWQKQMQEEARARAEAERAAREAEAARARAEREERAAREAYEAEQARLAKEAYEAEQARLAQEAYEAEQARLAQEAYARELEEYERQRAQYERDLAEYERQKAEYEAALAAQQAQEMQAAQEQVNTEFAQENPTPSRRRRRAVTYSDMVEGEAVEELPDAPQWTQMQPTQRIAPVELAAEEKEHKDAKRGILRSGVAKMAQMMEAETEDVTGITSLPPRVDRNAAYRPAKKPGKKA